MSYPGITNYVEEVPGTSVTAYLGVRDAEPSKWIYSLWTGEGDSEECIATGELDMSSCPACGGRTPSITPQQAARIAFLLDVEYGSHHA